MATEDTSVKMATTTTTSTTTTTGDDEKKEGFSFLLLGGCGFIGRNLVEYLITNNLASSIVVADKSLPVISYMHPTHKAFFESDIVTFKQADLALNAHVATVFKLASYDYVVNLCGETRFGLTEHDYQLRCREPATKCSIASQEAGVKRYVEVSTAQVYNPSKSAVDEDGKIAPWTLQAKFRHEAEEKIKSVTGLPYVILRPATCYGIGDLTGLSPRITCAAVYQKTGNKLSFLWTSGLSMNVVHVQDLCAAIWLACSELKPGTTYNVAEPSNVTQGDLNAVLGEIFGIKTGFLGTALSTAAKVNLTAVANISNDKHVPDWCNLCEEAGIYNTPLSPAIDKELLYCSNFRINGEKITKDSKFVYKTKFSVDTVREQIVAFIDQKIFPPVKIN